jgi:parvulin-like peptidyl-prolyl isomerase
VDVVAEVGGTPVTQPQLLLAWERRQRAVATNLPAAAVLGDLVDEAAAFTQAQRLGYLDRPDIQGAIRQLVVARYRDSRAVTNPAPIEPAEAEVRAAYAARSNTFVRPASLNLAILRHDLPKRAAPEKREEARRLVDGWRAEIAAAPDPAAAFAALTVQRSADAATRYRRGEVGWAGPDELRRRLPPEVVSAAESIEPGALSAPIETDQGFYLVRLLGRRPPEVRPFEEMEPVLRHRLREQNRQAAEASFRAAVRAGLEIRTNFALLDTLVLTNRAGTNRPPAMPGE